MTTITINERTKAGKILLELAKLLAVRNKGVKIQEESFTTLNLLQRLRNHMQITKVANLKV
ncbi:hypothetical protein [Flavobacterium sp.]|uniref:hypothetical protein n=1 Tax=Flavobacterium sp. TaxID=239 RepID=UPI00374D8A23